jgi:CMP-N-acetylneuraminic acid synthetase
MVTAIIGLKEISQRVPNKNFKLLGKIPLFAWVLDTLTEVEEISEIILNVEGKKLYSILNDYTKKVKKIKIIKREHELMGHETPMTEIINSTINLAENNIILNTHVTNPFLNKETIVNAIKLFKKNENPLFSVTKLQSRLYDKDLKPINHNPKILHQTQDLDVIYEENSCFYIFDKKQFSKQKTRIFENSTAYPISSIESVDIDTLEDWELAQVIAKGIQ